MFSLTFFKFKILIVISFKEYFNCSISKFYSPIIKIVRIKQANNARIDSNALIRMLSLVKWNRSPNSIQVSEFFIKAVIMNLKAKAQQNMQTNIDKNWLFLSEGLLQ
jgi:hypothetical protein